MHCTGVTVIGKQARFTGPRNSLPKSVDFSSLGITVKNVRRNTYINYMDYYSFIDPEGMEG